MPVENSPPAKNTRSQRNKVVLNCIARVPLNHKQSDHELSEFSDRRPPMEGEETSGRGGMKYRRVRSLSGFFGGYPGISQGPRSILGKKKGKRGRTPSNEPPVAQSKQSFFKLMKKMTQLMEQLTKEASPRETPRAPEFRTPSMNAPDSFYGTQALN
ncbi:hypothetical protein O181_068650 [Austropuccinia psidii MF-1]|uniref:Uncharacterized protein n=1 Tax=Austropuccinia psidii MF-1 TaxID=1389203 RepID=A0A9Q3F1E7_9BASI|nr:hypothetical protein [Austropuccinia psidii MF-1]